VRRPYPYGSEFVSQFLFAMRLCWFPLLVSTIAFGYEAPGCRPPTSSSCSAPGPAGRFFVLSSIASSRRSVGPAIVLAGVAGTAITADLARARSARKLDALQVLGIDPIKNLVVPRFWR